MRALGFAQDVGEGNSERGTFNRATGWPYLRLVLGTLIYLLQT